MLLIEDPIKLRFVEYDEKDELRLKQHLSYINRTVDFELRRVKENSIKYGLTDKIEQKIQELQKLRKGCLLFKDDKGYFTHSGLSKHLSILLNDQVTNKVNYPEPRSIPWFKPDPRIPYPYQKLAHDNLLDIKHGNVEIATGLGKSKIILDLVRNIGLKTTIVTPSRSIAYQLLSDFTNYLGKKYVGQYFDSKKDAKKLIVISVANSLANLTEEDPDYQTISASRVVISDESHTVPANMFADVFLGILSKAEYRFFFSGTQLRQDGLQLLLDSIIGPQVFKMTLKEGIDQGYLAKLKFSMIKCSSDSEYTSKDANKLTRNHFYFNPDVNEKAGFIINSFCDQGKQVLVLIDEVKQFSHLLPHLKHTVAFAHAGLNEANIDDVPEAFQSSDPIKLVSQFNNGHLPILVGTSCIGVGTDVRNNGATIYLVGGKSEVAVRQGAIGRSTRREPRINKTSCDIIDFVVLNQPTLKRHGLIRKSIYEKEGFVVKMVDLD